MNRLLCNLADERQNVSRRLLAITFSPSFPIHYSLNNSRFYWISAFPDPFSCHYYSPQRSWDFISYFAPSTASELNFYFTCKNNPHTRYTLSPIKKSACVIVVWNWIWFTTTRRCSSLFSIKVSSLVFSSVLVSLQWCIVVDFSFSPISKYSNTRPYHCCFQLDWSSVPTNRLLCSGIEVSWNEISKDERTGGRPRWYPFCVRDSNRCKGEEIESSLRSRCFVDNRHLRTHQQLPALV